MSVIKISSCVCFAGDSFVSRQKRGIFVLIVIHISDNVFMVTKSIIYQIQQVSHDDSLSTLSTLIHIK